jgi:predicted patatin/cPLA2 family phospholipase
MFRSIAFGGGGVRGGLHIGALMALEKVRGNLVFPDGVYGSSIGSIIATAVAFQLNATQIRTMFDAHFHLSSVIPPLRLSSVHSYVSKKGAFSMDGLETTILAAFDSQGVDLRSKLIKDAPQTLRIVASNLTTCKTTFLTGDVPLVKALLCSCCLPMVFEPQILYNNVYLDGGVCMGCLDKHVPADCLVIHISRPPQPIYPSDLPFMTPLMYMGRLYDASRGEKMHKNTLWIENLSIFIMQEITPEQKRHLIEDGYSQTLAFLTQRGAKEGE